MKKPIVLLLVLLSAHIACAQITYEGTKNVIRFGSDIQRITASPSSFPDVEQDGILVGDYFMVNDFGLVDGNPHYDIYNADLSIVKSFLIKGSWFGVPIGIGTSDLFVWNFISQGIFTTDGKWACLVTEYEKKQLADASGEILGYEYKVKELRVVDEDGMIIATLPYSGDTKKTTLSLVKIGKVYKLFVPTGDDTADIPYSYDIYSLPGDGAAQVISSVSAPKSKARKFIHEDQVLIERNNCTYDAKGQELK